jgi:carboxypeptidase C (cathepsin A)
MISERVNYEFIKNLDHLHPTQYNVAALLDRGVDVLIYVGNYDLVCDWVGNEKWTSKLEWSGGDAFRAEGMREWKVNGKRAGLTRGVEGGKGLTFATIDGAGHMVSYTILNSVHESLTCPSGTVR